MRYITPKALADALGISLKTVDRWVASGALPPPVRGKGPKGVEGWRRWPASVLVPFLLERGHRVPSAWAQEQAA